MFSGHPYRSCLQKSDSVECLLYVGYLFSEACRLALHRSLHKLVFSVPRSLVNHPCCAPDWRLRRNLIRQRLPAMVGLFDSYFGICCGAPSCNPQIPLYSGPPQQFDSRNHFLKFVHRRLDLGARRDVVLNLVNERRERYTSWVGGRIFAGERSFYQYVTSSISSCKFLPDWHIFALGSHVYDCGSSVWCCCAKGEIVLRQDVSFPVFICLGGGVQLWPGRPRKQFS